jgi:hypothetical protein
MFALPGTVLLIVFIYFKPQEHFLALRQWPLLYLFTLLALFGMAIDVRLGLTRLRPAPQLLWAVAFYLWGLLCTALRAPEALAHEVMFIIQLCLFVVVGQAVQRFRALQWIVGVLLAIGLSLAAIGVHQGIGPRHCLQVRYVERTVVLHDEGRECEDREACEGDNAEPGVDYRCERVGLLGTSTIRDRVRYRGTMEDPNELALNLGIVLPFAFAFFDRRRSGGRAMMLLASCVLIGLCAVFTQSRGGQLVVIAVLGVYFLRRIGLKRGLLLAAVLAVPVLLYGGRSDSGADASTEGRLSAWAEGWDMFLYSPLFGFGMGQFAEHHYLTAHSSYVLAFAELGFPGFFLFSVILYLSVKIPATVLRRRDMAPVATIWSVATLAAMIGLLVGIAFLSFTYKEQLWICVGTTAALYHCVKHHEPTFEVSFTWREAMLVAAGDAAFIGLIRLYTTYKGV